MTIEFDGIWWNLGTRQDDKFLRNGWFHKSMEHFMGPLAPLFDWYSYLYIFVAKEKDESPAGQERMRGAIE